LGKGRDIFIGILTSSNSLNVIAVVHASEKRGLNVFVMSGHDDGELGKFILVSGYTLCVTVRIQETHITAGHITCELIEKIMFNYSEEEKE